MKKRLIIPASQFPIYTNEDVKRFQFNNRIKIDGIVGPETRETCWRKAGDKAYTHLCWHDRRKRGALESQKWIKKRLSSHTDLPLDPESIDILLYLLSSEYSTGLDYVSTQDAATMGVRRYAGRTLRGLLLIAGRDLPGIPGKNNTGPLATEEGRIDLLELASSPLWWRLQLEKYLEDLRENLEKNGARSARYIALFERANNSGERWVAGHSCRHNTSICSCYRELRNKYLGHPRGQSRIRRIEDAIEAETTWR